MLRAPTSRRMQVMKSKLPVLVTLNRRQFLVGAAAVGVAACGPVPTEGSDAGPGFNSGDDAGPDATDAGEGPACPAGVVETMEPAAFMTGKPAYFANANAFIVRDSGGLFAVTSICTHQGCTITAETSDFYCMCHGSEFSFTGSVLHGPAQSPLQHYALCLSNGVVGIDTNSVVPSTQRLNV